jgi:hypothetical protein
MIQIYGDLHLTSLDPEQHAKTCGYWYVVRTVHFPHTAFRTRTGLERWLAERALALSQPLPVHGTWSTQTLVGTYRLDVMLDRQDLADHDFATDGALAAPRTLAAWQALTPVLTTRDVSNGSFTEAKITLDGDGIRTVHILNPNVHSRVVYDYIESQILMDS